jgi:predicted transcriptional regulator
MKMGKKKRFEKRDLIITAKTLARNGHPVREIGELLGISPTTVQTYKRDDCSEAQWERKRSSRLDAFKEEIETLINESKVYGKQSLNNKTAHMVFCKTHPEIKISYEAFNSFVNRRCKITSRRELAKIPLEHFPGEAQIDFCAVKYKKNGKWMNGHGFTMSFPFSNARFIVVYPSENQQCLFHAMITIFEAIGFVPRSVIFDNATSAVSKVSISERDVNKRYEAFAAHYGFEAKFCSPSSGWEKGNVERNNAVLRKKFLSPPPEIDNEQDFNQHLIDLCLNDMSHKHYRKRETIQALFERDKTAGLPLPATRFDHRRFDVRHVDNTGLIRFDGNEYSTSDRHANMDVTIMAGAFEIEIFEKDGKPIWKHPRSYEEGKRIIAKEAYCDALNRKPSAKIASTDAIDILNTIRPAARKQFIQDCIEAANTETTPFSWVHEIGATDLDRVKENYDKLIKRHTQPVQPSPFGDAVQGGCPVEEKQGT